MRTATAKEHEIADRWIKEMQSFGCTPDEMLIIIKEAKNKFLKFKETEPMDKGATISKCGNHRYKLWRIWDKQKPLCFFLLHNPSTADGVDDDPTIRRCIGFAKSWGYGGIYIGNIFSYRATDPKELLKLKITDLTNETNYGYINQMFKICQMHILAFGNPVVKFDYNLEDSAGEVWHYLKKTKLGHPCHPLYLHSDLKPIKC